jgi:hypothetical protein
MGLLTGLVTLPLAPVRGTVWIAEQVQREAERQYYDPALIRRRLEDVDDARQAGRLTEDEAAELEDQLLARMREGIRRRDQREMP